MNQWKGIFGILALVCGILAVTMSANAGDGGVPLPHLSKATDGENCVEPVDVMRRQHMVFLQHQRDDTLREGIRGQKHSLNGCIDCHATADPKIAGGKIRTLKPFCAQCHDYAAVSLDCFSCHNPTAPLKTEAGDGQ